MSSKKQLIGLLGENIAVKYLSGKKYQILERNIHFREGEIDILAKFKGKYIFIEVKTRTNKNFGNPEEALTNIKMVKFLKAIEKYQQKNPQVKQWRADCLAILIDQKEKRAQIYHLSDLDFSFD